MMRSEHGKARRGTREAEDPSVGNMKYCEREMKEGEQGKQMRGREKIMRPYNVNGVGGEKRVDKIEGRDGVKKIRKKGWVGWGRWEKSILSI